MKRTKNEIFSLAKKYDHKIVFATKEPSAYKWLSRKKLINQACSHMKKPERWKEKTAFRWDKKEAFKIAKKYKYRIDLITKDKSCYKYLQSNGFLDKACKHMTKKDISMVWNKTSAFKVAQKVASLYYFKNYHFSCYSWLKKNNLLTEACKHMELKTRWNKVSAFKEAKKHNQRTVFMRSSSGCYKWLKKNNLLEEACSHMDNLMTNWDKASAFKEAKRCKTRAQLRIESSGCYYWLLRHNLLDQAGKHFEEIQKFREKDACNLFLKKLKKYDCIIHREYLIYFQNKKCFIDFYIEIPEKNMSFAVEYKHDASSWTKKHLDHQVGKYNQAFKGNNTFQGTYLVSNTGKHGFSEKQFIYILDVLDKTGELLLPNSLNCLRNN